jgi:hypothetical protein
VCVAESQLEKLRTVLLDIRQTHVILEQNLRGGGGCEYDQQRSDVQTQRKFSFAYI